jgi:hypothetical protein
MCGQVQYDESTASASKKPGGQGVRADASLILPTTASSRLLLACATITLGGCLSANLATMGSYPGPACRILWIPAFRRSSPSPPRI